MLSMKKSQNVISWIYLGFAICGALLTTLANIDFVKSYGNTFDIIKFIQLSNINPAAQSISRDLLVSASAIFTWIILESRRLKMKNLWIVVLTTFTIAFAFSAPLFLFLRERRLIEISEECN